ncbi:MAG: hypothetical protein AAGB29_14410 [Planctomycetota bacterium]
MGRAGEHMSVFEHLEAIVITTLVASLVWLWAEGKDVRRYVDEVVPVELVAPTGMEGALVIEPTTLEVQATFETSSAQYDEFIDVIDEGPVLVTVSPPGEGDTSLAPLNLQAELEAGLFSSLRIDLEELQPGAVEVRVDRLVERTLPVSLLYPSDASLAQPPSAQPSEAIVRLPASLAEAAGETNFRVRLTSEMLSAAAAGEPVTLTVPLELPEALRSAQTELLTRSVDVTFTVTRQTETLTIERLTVQVRQSPLVMRRYDVVLPEDEWFVRDIELSGPASAIAAIRAGEDVVTAEIAPTLDDLERGVTSLPVEIETPTGVEVVSPIPQVAIQATPRPLNGTPE